MQMLLQTFTACYSSTSCEHPHEYDSFIYTFSTIMVKGRIDTKPVNQKGFVHKCLCSLVGHAITMWYIAVVGHIANEILLLFPG